ncbi:cytochrome c oxidase subunit II [Paraburkholderia sp. LEh10]|uniref:cytochrome c oxidase subunit II n=1 Tax=Paraburkholderia sp. LEh10 TaxID=2821353 RepID=UPI001AE2C505|nr:cytochrome c oxidase subunit II [Paraburkholderia sp. LEh10]MBP0588372.1 cytochrome c oxidase subunit II [Paraburkholderia sp. LEh10]
MSDAIRFRRESAHMHMRLSVAALSACLAALNARAAPQQSALEPAGIQAARILDLWNLTLFVCGVVFAAVLLATLIALVRAQRSDAATAPEPTPDERIETRTRRGVIAASSISVVLLVGLVVADVLTDRALSKLPVANPVRIELTGQQWWWQAVYPSDSGQPGFTTANELHVPAGRPVVVALKAGDVIHTFWVPNLHGKKDMLPGIQSTIEFRADKPGVYRGQCAEYCGAEHALMAMLVVADSPEQYSAWRTHQASAAEPSADALPQRGWQVFERSTCAGCHTVRGTSAQGTLGPDLTHLMSRQTIAAGMFANTQANLQQWVRDPNALKPGTTMPAVPLAADDLRAVVAWLGTLQ